MPWKKRAGKEWFEWDLAGLERARQEPWSANRFMRWYWRNLADAFRIHRLCRRKACRRAGACSTEDVACFREQEEAFRLVIFPAVRKARAASAGEAAAPYDPDAADVARDRRQWEERDARRGKGKGGVTSDGVATTPA
ncbi:hypothetical protein BH10PSE9_BH10PSE9_24080 [soil metagenome]